MSKFKEMKDVSLKEALEGIRKKKKESIEELATNKRARAAGKEKK